MRKAQQAADRFLPELTCTTHHHLLRFERWQQDHIKVLDKEERHFVMEFIHEMSNLLSHPVTSLLQTLCGLTPRSLCTPAEPVEMRTEALDAREISVGKLATTLFGKKRHERTDTGIECHDAPLGLGFASWHGHRDSQVVRAVGTHQPTVSVDRRQRLAHAQRVQERVIDTVRRHGRLGDIERLHRVFARPKGDKTASTRLCATFGFSHRLARITNSDRLDLIRDGGTPVREVVQDLALDALPVGFRPWLCEVFNRSVKYKP
jgi:hypothetical protein